MASRRGRIDPVDSRRAHAEEIAGQWLREGVRGIARRELDAIDATTRENAEPWAPAEARERTAGEDRVPRSKWISPWEPRRPSGGCVPASANKARS